jgi:hypothetical protein
MCRHEFIFSADETCWHPYEAPPCVLAEKGSGNMRMNFTRGEKLPFAGLGQLKQTVAVCLDGSLQKAKLTDAIKYSANIRMSSFGTRAKAGRPTACFQTSSSG